MQQVDGFGGHKYALRAQRAKQVPPRRDLPCASLCKTWGNRGSFYFASGIESSIESGYIQDHELSLKMVALVQSDSGGDDGARMGEMEFKDC